ncbi:MAG: hypothetical protein L6R38_001975 [Xanthoria sp. 2 TBL-2021]|nr:MAG: hypothetical protein L6R38_001975 [Xanthoria sp. 2 TBL-2021]
MKQLYALLCVFTLLQFLNPILAANAPGSADNVIVTPRLGEDPPPGEQIRVHGTNVQVLFRDYLPVRRVDTTRYFHAAHNALYDIIKSLSVAPVGDHGVHAPNLGPWRFGEVYITAHNPYLRMTWEILANALRGVLDFYDNWGMMKMVAIIVEIDLGYIGELRVATGYLNVGNVTAAENANVTETA